MAKGTLLAISMVLLLIAGVLVGSWFGSQPGTVLTRSTNVSVGSSPTPSPGSGGPVSFSPNLLPNYTTDQYRAEEEYQIVVVALATEAATLEHLPTMVAQAVWTRTAQLDQRVTDAASTEIATRFQAAEDRYGRLFPTPALVICPPHSGEC